MPPKQDITCIDHYNDNRDSKVHLGPPESMSYHARFYFSFVPLITWKALPRTLSAALPPLPASQPTAIIRDTWKPTEKPEPPDYWFCFFHSFNLIFFIQRAARHQSVANEAREDKIGRKQQNETCILRRACAFPSLSPGPMQQNTMRGLLTKLWAIGREYTSVLTESPNHLFISIECAEDP